MLQEDEDYMQSVLKTFGVTKYKLSETPTRFKLILTPDRFTMETLDEVQCLRGAVGIEVDVQKHVFVECLKSGHARKRRRITANTFKGTIPKAYDVGKYNPVMREFLGVEDVCAFDAEVKEGVLEIRNIECLPYALLKRVADASESVEFDMVKHCIRVSMK
tara:strand:- start:561 stop:1043 length:483 start_codon:yes stop_codon:yes gene_type:complete